MTIHSIVSNLLLNPSRSVVFVRNLLLMGICVLLLNRVWNSWGRYHREQDPSLQVEHRISRNAFEKNRLREPQRVDTEVIIEQNIFGGSAFEPSQKEKMAADLERIPLAEDLKQFLLIGTIVKSDAANIAVIEDRHKKEQKMYVQGDQLQGATIKRIYRNNVILHDGTADKMLSIDYKIREKMQQLNDKTPQVSEEDRGQRIVTVERDDVLNLFDMESILKNTNFRPILTNNTPQGFELSQIQNGSLFDILQLHDGDILLGTRQTEYRNINQLKGIIEAFRNEGQIALRIIRNGQDMTIAYRLQ